MSQTLILSLSLLLLTLTLTPQPTTLAQPPPSFKCTTKSTCKSLVGYIPLNTTTLSHIQSLFQVKTLRTLLGVNNLPETTPPNFTIPANSTVKIPFPCRCINGTGLSNQVPKYTVVKNDGLFHIAAQLFSGLVTDQQIQAANKIKNANLIIVGQKLWVPLPCSCDDVAGEKVVHYAHVVAGGSSFEQIADEFGTSAQSLMNVNGVTDPKQLIAGQVLDVPLRACISSVSNTSFDYPLLVPNGTYVDTAHNCVKCKCDAANNFVLDCQPSMLKAIDWPSCPTMQCSLSNNSVVQLGISMTSGCTRSTCAYAGYMKNRTINTTMAEDNTCAAAPGPEGSTSEALKMQMGGWSSVVVLLCIQFLMLERFL